MEEELGNGLEGTFKVILRRLFLQNIFLVFHRVVDVIKNDGTGTNLKGEKIVLLDIERVTF